MNALSLLEMRPGRPGWAGLLAAARADFLQRVRSFRFLAVLMATVATGMLMLPTQDAGYVVLEVGDARGLYGSAWVGLVFGVVGAVILPLFGFFIVKDALARDRATRVGLLLAASPLGRFGYLGAKLLSNISIFVAILAVSSLMAFVMQWWRHEDSNFHVLDLLVHLWVIPLPVLLATSALALLFECVPGLRGAFGNVVFFFVWVGVLGPGMSRMEADEQRIVSRSADFFGISAPLADFEDRLDIVNPGHKGGLSIGANIGGSPPLPIAWSGIAGDSGWLLERLCWLLVSLPLLALAVLFFDRFDPGRGRRRGAESNAVPGSDESLVGAARPWHQLTPLPKTTRRWRPLTMLRAELSLLLKRRPLWWYGVVIGLWIAGVALTTEQAVRWVVPVAWMWGITCFSEHGARQQLHGTHSLLASAPAPLLRQLPLQWLAATLFAVFLVAGPLVKLLLFGQLGGLAQVVVGAGFVASLSLALGGLSGGTRLFELVFLLLWYAAMQSVPGAGFSGNAALDFGSSLAPAYLVVAVLLFVLAWTVRALQLRR